jgi:hypothetical protein
MAIASITQWLDNPNRSYHHGVKLYEQYGTDRVILALIRSGTGSYHYAKLRAGLEAVNKNSNLQPKPIVVSQLLPEISSGEGKKNPDFTGAPDEIEKIRTEKTVRYAQARDLFANIRYMDSRENRLQAGLELLNHMDFVNDSWLVIDEWKETGKVLELNKKETEKTVSELTMAELLKESKNLPTYISKTSRKLKDAKSPALKVKFAKQLEERKHRFDLVKKRLEEI